MGHHRPKTPRLGEKLRQIRKRVGGGLTQNELVERLRLKKDFDQERISKYERGVLEPPVYVLIAYSDLTGIPLDVILRPEHDIPEKIPARRGSSASAQAIVATHKSGKARGKRP